MTGATSDLIDRIDRHRRRDELREGLDLAREAVQAHPDDAGLRIAYGRVLLAADYFTKAEEQFTTAGEDDALATAWRIAALARQWRIQAALDLGDQAVSRFPADPMVRIALGRVHLDMSRPAEGLPHFAEAARIAPDEWHAVAWHAYGLAECRRWAESASLVKDLEARYGTDGRVRALLGDIAWLSDVPEAIRHFTAAAEAAPDYAYPREWLVEGLQNQERVDDADEVIAESSTLFPGSARVLVDRAWALSGEDDEAGALSTVEKALELAPHSIWALCSRIDFLRHAHRYAEADRAAAEVLAVFPAQPRVHTTVAWLRHHEDRSDDALAELDKALAIAPTHGRALRSRLSILRASGRLSPAELVEAASAARELRPDDHGILVALAWARYRAGDVEGAFEVIEQAVGDRQAEPSVHDNHVQLLRDRNLLSEAEEAALAALERHPRNADLRLEYAWVLRDQGRLDEACAAARKAAEGAPRSAHAQASLARMLRICERFGEAQEVLDAALTAHPRSLTVHIEQIYLLSAREENEAASAAMGRVLALSPENPWLLENRIFYLRVAGQLGEAERVADDAVGRYPRNANLHKARALVLSASGRNTEALASMETALNFKPRDPGLLKRRVDCLFALSRFAEATEAARRALEVHPRNVSLLTELGWTLSAQYRHDDALAAIDRALAISPSHAWAYRSRIWFLRQAERFDDAETAAGTEIFSLAEDRALLHADLARTYASRGRHREALIAAERAVAAAPKNEWVLLTHIRMLGNERKYAAAEEAAKKALLADPGRINIHLELASIYSAQDREDDAAAQVAEALAVAPANATALGSRIDYLRYGRRFPEMRKAVQDALELQPDAPDLLVTMASAYDEEDRYDEAVAVLERALAIAPDHAAARRKQVQLLVQARRFDEAEKAAKEALDHNDGPAILLTCAVVASARDEHEKALALMLRTREAHPHHVDTHKQLITTLLKLHRPAEAEAAATEALAARGDSTVLAAQLAHTLAYQRDHERALATLAPHLDHAPHDVTLRLAQSAILRSARRCAEAEREIERLAARIPHEWDLRVELGWIHHDAQRLTEARQCFTKLVAEAVNGDERAEARRGRGWVEFADGNYPTAEAEFRSALADRPDDFDLLLGLAWSLARQAGRGKQQEAVAIAGGLAERMPDPAVHVCLGVLAFEAGRPASAEYHFKRSLTISPHQGSHTDLGALYAQMGRYEEAKTELTAAIARDWYDAPAHVELGSLLLRGGDDHLGDAEREFRQALAIDSAYPEAAIGLAQSLAKSGEEAEAESTLRSALNHQVASKRWRTHLALARILVLRGDKQQNADLHAEAYAEAQRAIDTAPNNEAEPHFVAGVAHHRMGSLASDARGRFGYRRRAMIHLRECLERDPGHADAQRNKLLLEREMKATAPAVWGGYAVATISLVLLGVEWATFYFTDKVTALMLSTTTPVFVGLFTIAVLLPALIRLKLPGFEADLQAGAASITPGPTGQVTFSPRFIVTTGPTGHLPRHGAGGPTAIN